MQSTLTIFFVPELCVGVEWSLVCERQIDVGWVFVGKANFEDVATMRERVSKCKTMLTKTMDYQLHLLAMKLGMEHDIDYDKKMASTPNIKKEGTTLTCVF